MDEGVENIVIRTADDFVTNLDSVDQKSNYFRKVRGIRNLGVEFVAQRDFGTINRFASLPTGITIIPGGIHTFHDNTTGYDHEILICLDTTHSRIKIFVDTSVDASGTWLELTRKILAKVNGTPSTTTNTVNIDTITEDGASLTLSTNSIQYYYVYNINRTNSALIISSAATSLTGYNYFGADGMAWQNDDDLVIFRTTACLKAYIEDSTAFTTTLLGTTPHFEFNPIQSQRKVNVYFGNSDTEPTMQRPVQILNRTIKNYFPYDSGGTTLYLLTLPARWEMETMGGGLIPFYTATADKNITESDGTPTATTTVEVTDQFADDKYLAIAHNGSIQAGVVGHYYWAFAQYLTLCYNDYEESDPILKLEYYGDYVVSTYTGRIEIGYSIRIDPANLNKCLSSIRFYMISTSFDDCKAGLRASFEGPADNYKLQLEQSIEGDFVDTSEHDWALVPTDPDGQIFQLLFTSYLALGSTDYVQYGNKSLLDELQHKISTTRTIKKPRCGVTMIRSENPLSVIDIDDRTLGYSSLDGDGAVEDDNFPEAGSDSADSLLRANLFGSLPLKKFINLNNQIHVFRQELREVVDTQSGYQGSRECDFYAKRSLVSSPQGLMWAGYSAIYFVPIGDSSEYVANLGWQNLFDGTLKIDDGSVSYITDAYRAAIIGGYDSMFQEFWFHCQVNKDAVDGGGSEYLCFRFSPENKRWTIRQLNIGASYSPVVAFSQRSDGTMTIVYSTGILKYPNRTGTYQYQDDVPSTGASVGKGIPTSFKLIIGEIADKIKQNVLLNILPDYKGSSILGTGRLQINLYANKETTAYDTQYFPVDTKEDEVRDLEERDNISELAIEVLIPSADLADVKDLDISSLYIGLRKAFRDGNL